MNGFLSYSLISVLVIIPFWKILQKAGFNPALSLLFVVPIINLVTLYYVAFTKWAAGDNSQNP